MTYSEYGDPDVLTMREAPVPKVGPGEVRIRVTRGSVNPVDWKLMAGGLDALIDAHFPVIPGWDVAGVIDAVGPDVPEFQEGDRVAAYARKQVNHAGTFAEYVTVWAADVAKVPDGVSDDVAAGLPLTGLTALRTLQALQVTDGDRLLIHAASGGVGSLAVQLAVKAGAKVVGTASAGKHERLREMGALPVAYGEGLEERLRDVASQGFDAVADFAGGTLQVTQNVLRRRGRMASVADPGYAEHGGSWIWVRPDGQRLSSLLTMVADGELTVGVDSTFELEDTRAAFERSRGGTAAGKIIIRVAD